MKLINDTSEGLDLTLLPLSLLFTVRSGNIEVNDLEGVDDMEIILGSIRPLPSQNKKPLQNKAPIAARLLHVRPPRKGISGPSGMERRTKQVKDPPRGRVLTIMVPDGSLLPSDIDNGQYDVSIRLIRR